MFILDYVIYQIAKYLTADNSVFPYRNANDMRVTQDLNSFGEIIAHAQCSVDEKIYIYIPCVPHENRIICCQIFCDLLLKSAFERIFNS
jgi:hypothetical protein